MSRCTWLGRMTAPLGSAHPEHQADEHAHDHQPQDDNREGVGIEPSVVRVALESADERTVPVTGPLRSARPGGPHGWSEGASQRRQGTAYGSSTSMSER
jgi:hypothetical protein